MNETEKEELDTVDRIAIAAVGYILIAVGVTLVGIIAYETGMATEERVQTVLSIFLGIPAAVGFTSVGWMIFRIALEGDS